MLDISLFLLGLNVNDHALPNGTEPLVFLDFKNGAYTVIGASVAVGSLVVENADYGNYSASDIHAGVGLVESNPTFFGDALDLIIGGSTILCTFTIPAPDAGATAAVAFEMVDSTDYNLDYFAHFEDDLSCYLDDGPSARATFPTLTTGRHKAALTMIDGKLAASIDGNTVFAVDPAVAWSPAPQVVILAVAGNAAVESIGLRR
jgi:hypothetical protein